MTQDPAEGVDADGHIVPGVARGRVRTPYEAVVTQAVTALRRELGGDLHSVWLYGSVATGRAQPPRSDVDLLAVVHRVGAAATCAQVAARLSGAHAELVREVGVATVTLETLLADDEAGRVERCFLRHYALRLVGPAITQGWPSCRASVTLARGFAAELPEAVARCRAAVEEGRASAEEIARTCRRILMAAATLISVRAGGWSTDRTRGAELIGEVFGATSMLAIQARWALRMGEDRRPAVPPAAEVLQLFDGLGS